MSDLPFVMAKWLLIVLLFQSFVPNQSEVPVNVLEEEPVNDVAVESGQSDSYTNFRSIFPLGVVGSGGYQAQKDFLSFP